MKRFRAKNNPLELDAILGFTSFIRDVEIEEALNAKSNSYSSQKSGWHLFIARRIEAVRLAETSQWTLYYLEII